MNTSISKSNLLYFARICALLTGFFVSTGFSQTDVSTKPSSPTPSKNAPVCIPQTQLDVSKIKQQIILLGESHGTKEIPEFTSGLVCSLLNNGRSVILAVERFAEEQEHLQRYIESEGTPSDKSALLGVYMWASQWQDGRSSEAMFALVEDIRKLRKSGQRVGILAMQTHDNLKVPMTDADRVPLSVADNNIYNNLNDRGMANNLLAAAVLYRNYTLVGLAGFRHTSTRIGSSRDSTYQPLGHAISTMVPTYIVGVTHDGGEFWGLKDRYGVFPFTLKEFFFDEDRVDAKIHFSKLTASPSANPSAAALAQKSH